uniref:RRP15-like protein n=1 Tax=Panagrellus redivivus TaxID=6233 RepID=A0A7E4VJB5_PANRE
MGKTTRPKSKAEKLADRRKHILDDDKADPLHEEFLDEGGSDNASSDDEMPEEVSTKKEEQEDDVPPLPEAKKKRKKRRVKKEAPGVFAVETDDVKLKVVAEASRTVSAVLHPTIHFKDLLIAETSKSGRRKAGAINKHATKWLKPQRATRQT